MSRDREPVRGDPGEYTRDKTAFVSQALREKKEIPGVDPQLGLVALGLAREDFAGHFVDTLGDQVTQP
jgi:hypothetical protein